MKNEIYSQTYALKEALSADPRIILLNETEKRMNDDSLVMALAYKKDVASSRYSEMLSIYHSEDAEEVKKARNELVKAKSQLYDNSIVKEYLNAYQIVRLMYQNINEKIFSFIEPHMCPKEEE
ncbi:MAG TPA: YlbF family regulator [Bacilli bacterium]|nr:YlbF family regulator [Bacilli bacterium]